MDKYKIKTTDQIINLDSPKFWKRLEKSPHRILSNIQPWKHCKTSWRLQEWAIFEMGRVLYYMKYFFPKTDWGDQKERVEKMCQTYRDQVFKHCENTRKNRLWLKKFIFKFMDETENMC